jgi:thiol-disulfide isomerase/thioredoxin
MVTVDLRAGEFAAGRLLSLTADGSLSVEVAGLVDPLSVPANRGRSIGFSGAAAPPAQGEWLAELVDGGMLRGSLVGLDAEKITMKVESIGEVAIDRKGIVRLVRTSSEANGVVIGNGQLNQWKRSKGWKEEAGHLVTTELNGTLSMSAPENPSYVLDVELSWPEAPSFRIDASGRFQGKELKEACTLETWGDKLVFVMESKGTLRMKQIGTLSPLAGRGRWQFYVDPSKGRGIISSSGKVLAEFEVPPQPRTSYFGMEVHNLGAGLVLEQWSLVNWDGKPPLAKDSSKATVTLAEEKVIEGRVESWDSSSNAFQLPEGSTPTTVRGDVVREIGFETNPGAEPSPHHVLGRNGYRLAGRIEGIDGDSLRWKIAGGEHVVAIPLTSIGSIHWSGSPPDEPARPEATGRIGDLTSKEMRLTGFLVEGDGVRWHSQATGGVVQPRLDQQTRIIYRREDGDAESAKPTSSPTPVAVPQGNVIAQMFRRQPRSNPGKELAAAGDHLIHLRTGDQLPGVVQSLDDQGIHFTSKMTSATFLKHDDVQVVEFDPNAAPVPIVAMKKQRLLTIPRVARDNPPTHLLRLNSGDYLRCRLLGMDAQSLEVEIRLERRKVARSSVARVIWLRSEEQAGAMAGNLEGRVQTVSLVGDRLTFKPTRVEGGSLVGESLALESCRSPIIGLAEIVLGPAISEATKDLAFQSWRLRPAIEPLPDPGDGEGGSTGKESGLVGKPAPDFELDLCANGKFKLSEHREEILVLDFWASWCGPCMNSMPSVNEVVKEFEGKKVTLLAINLEESKEEAVAAMTRLGLQLPVALDIDGEVAGLYEVKGIPQTVVVKKGGEISRVFVGGGIEEELRSALKEETAPAAPVENLRP